MKRKLIILSMSPLFFLIFIQNFPWLKVDTILTNGFNKEILLNHIFLIMGLLICILWNSLSCIIWLEFKYFYKYGNSSGYQIQQLVEEREAGLTFFLTLILPLMINDISTFNGLLLMVVLVAIIIKLLAKTNLYYQNPILIILGYRVYRFSFTCNSQYVGECIGIAINELNISNTIEYKNIEENVFVVKQ